MLPADPKPAESDQGGPVPNRLRQVRFIHIRLDARFVSLSGTITAAEIRRVGRRDRHKGRGGCEWMLEKEQTAMTKEAASTGKIEPYQSAKRSRIQDDGEDSRRGLGSSPASGCSNLEEAGGS